MRSINPKYIIALITVIAIVIILKVTNPYSKYSTEDYWLSATIESVYEIPDEALASGNKNGSVLMWAASFTDNPGVITALVERGADINEAEARFLGTPLTGASVYSKNPAVIKELIRLGADINVRASNNNTALMAAAMFNENPGVIEELITHGASVKEINIEGKTALDLAKENDNKNAVRALTKYR